MTERTYALIASGVVQQLLVTNEDISTMFAPGLRWVLIADPAGVSPGYHFDGTNFTAAVPPAAPASIVSLAQLQAEVAALQGAIAALMATH